MRGNVSSISVFFTVKLIRKATTLATEPMICESIAKVFFIALFLTGSAKRAEAVTLKGLESLDPEDPDSEVWLRESAIASTQDLDGDLVPQFEELEQAGIILAPELRNVLRLPAPARSCFVLRTLAGFRPEFCADLLRLDLDQLDEATCDAVSALAGFSDPKVEQI
jgi:hypothetical protein